MSFQNPIEARFGKAREPLEVVAPAWPGSLSYWTARFADGEEGTVPAHDIYTPEGQRWLDPPPRKARPAWTRNPVKHKWKVGDRVARKWQAKWGAMPPMYAGGTITELRESADNRGKAKPGYLVRWDGDPGIPYPWLQEELREVGRKNPAAMTKVEWESLPRNRSGELDWPRFTREQWVRLDAAVRKLENKRLERCEGCGAVWKEPIGDGRLPVCMECLNKAGALQFVPPNPTREEMAAWAEASKRQDVLAMWRIFDRGEKRLDKELSAGPRGRRRNPPAQDLLKRARAGDRQASLELGFDLACFAFLDALGKFGRRPLRLSADLATHALRAYYRALGYQVGQYGSLVAPDGSARLRFHARVLEVQAPGPAGWTKVGSHGLVAWAKQLEGQLGAPRMAANPPGEAVGRRAAREGDEETAFREWLRRPAGSFVFQIKNGIVGGWKASGRVFNVELTPVLELPKQRFGGDWFVIFHDATYAGQRSFGELGQRVAGYYASTILAGTSDQNGMDLMGHEPVWKVDSVAMSRVFGFLRQLPQGA